MPAPTRGSHAALDHAAGRYLPEYRELRKRVDFLDLCRTPELAAEATLQPLRRFPLDAFGIRMTFSPGPKIAEPLRSRAQVDALEARPAAEAVPFVADAVHAFDAAPCAI